MNNGSNGKTVLSVYLGTTDKVSPDSDFLSAQLHSLIHQRLSAAQRHKWQKDIERINGYLHQFLDRSNVRSWVFFTSGKALWQALNFEFSLPVLCKVDSRPYLQPLERAVNQHRRYLVLLADRAKARMFTVYLGKIEDRQDIFSGEVPQNVKAKKTDYGRDDKIFRHIEQHLYYYLKKVAKATQEFCRGKRIYFIILGSHKYLLPKIKHILPYPLNKMVLGEFVTELNIPLNKVLIHSKKVATEVNRRLYG